MSECDTLWPDRPTVLRAALHLKAPDLRKHNVLEVLQAAIGLDRAVCARLRDDPGGAPRLLDLAVHVLDRVLHKDGAVRVALGHLHAGEARQHVVREDHRFVRLACGAAVGGWVLARGVTGLYDLPVGRRLVVGC